MISVSRQILVILDLYSPTAIPREKLLDLACSHPDCDDRVKANEILSQMESAGLVIEELGYFSLPEHEPEEIPKDYLRAADNLRRARNPSLLSRFCAVAYRDRYALALILCVLVTTAGCVALAKFRAPVPPAVALIP